MAPAATCWLAAYAPLPFRGPVNLPLADTSCFDTLIVVLPAFFYGGRPSSVYLTQPTQAALPTIGTGIYISVPESGNTFMFSDPGRGRAVYLSGLLGPPVPISEKPLPTALVPLCVLI